jgi:hypothetical protein
MRSIIDRRAKLCALAATGSTGLFLNRLNRAVFEPAQQGCFEQARQGCFSNRLDRAVFEQVLTYIPPSTYIVVVASLPGTAPCRGQRCGGAALTRAAWAARSTQCKMLIFHWKGLEGFGPPLTPVSSFSADVRRSPHTVAPRPLPSPTGADKFKPRWTLWAA